MRKLNIFLRTLENLILRVEKFYFKNNNVLEYYYLIIDTIQIQNFKDRNEKVNSNFNTIFI
jgi:hypothetical protein